MRRNSDERLRQLERAFESDPRDMGAAQRYGLELLRRGSTPSEAFVAAGLVSVHTADMLDVLPTEAWIAWLTPGAKWEEEPEYADPDFADGYPSVSDGSWEMNYDVPGWIVSHEDPSLSFRVAPVAQDASSREPAPARLYRVTTTFYGPPGEQHDVVAADPIEYDEWEGLPRLREELARQEGWVEYWAMVAATGRDPLRQVRPSARQRISEVAQDGHDDAALQVARIQEEIAKLEPDEADEPEDDEEDADDGEGSDPEPEEGDLATEDHREFWVIGGPRRGPVVVVPEDDDWRPHVRAYFEREGFWPNVWWQSDHGNMHLLSLNDD